GPSREPEGAAEGIVETGAVLAGQRETGLHERILADALPGHHREQHVPALGRETEPEPPRDLGIDAALLEIGPRLLAAALPERLVVELGGEGHHAGQRPELALGLGGAAPR